MLKGQQAIMIGRELDKLDLSAEIHRRNSLLIKYAQLSIRTCQLMAESNEGNPDNYTVQLDQLHQQIRTIIKALSAR